ncbi:MAG: glycoside hydrolase family protein [Cyanobacteria bacterium]|nr:glycoside hydrolase family protein [Cyanobacteria bacterium CG_2015-16_32_12]NCO78902.1 glycoside hydrolase family protein [Cyanobacteria bacterium CG_2015-22_32_23]NCQ04979.1 glycoside hydrolase family protein [Cyanobacteria bacterium CG_2015-09_32_10]NCQ42439.1 glycoside hydrolase family protein [Cyanobacteria bacterium CG_2015-04_32_10]NCS84224.1 glycoside hydrolase family protein [Cyanobacteria bacterium CG_2015-02_32_10]
MTNLSNEKQNFSSLLSNSLKTIILLIMLSGLINFLIQEKKNPIKKASQHFISSLYGSPPLVMKGGNPYIRALMRTISASESNYLNPYHVIYSGKYVSDLSKHPDICVTIENGPNEGKCTTASGRYQFLNTTWAEKAAEYHPHPSKFLLWKDYSFEPEFQDEVLYKWLTDSHSWNTDITLLLEKGEIEQVLKLLSPTWTSLGYGIENNSMSQYLPQIYKKLLKEELANKT